MRAAGSVVSDNQGCGLHPACCGRENQSDGATASRRNRRTRTCISGYAELIEVCPGKRDTADVQGKRSRAMGCYGLG